MSFAVHADLDAFFLSVEVALDPHLRGRPCAVSGGGVIVSASYQARQCGITAGMSARAARARQPELTVLPGRLDAYRSAARHLFRDLTDLADDYRRLSIDEASWGSGGHQDTWENARRHARDTYGLPLSVGLAPTRLTARIACAHAKPDGILVVHDADAFLADLPAGDLPGVGPATREKLAKLSIHTVTQLKEAPAAQLRAALGEHTARMLADLANGHQPEAPAATRTETTGTERTFPQAINGAAAQHAYEEIRDSALHRLADKASPARAVTVTLRSMTGQTSSRSAHTTWPTSDVPTLTAAADSAWALVKGTSCTGLRVTFTIAGTDQPTLDLQVPGTRSALPPRPALTLPEIVHVGLPVRHASFGPGTITGRQADTLGVRFADRTRLIDQHSGLLAVELPEKEERRP